VSEHGCALLLPGDLAPPQPGALFPRARLQLDDATCLDLGLELLHVTCMNDGAAGLRLGFRFVDVSDAAGGVLRRYLEQAGAVGQSGLSSPV
jgi:hypothetical protein